jgi:hypothetical protein
MDRLRAAAAPLQDLELLQSQARIPSAHLELCFEGSWCYSDGARFFKLWRNGEGYLADCLRIGQFLIEASGRRVTYYRDPEASTESFEDYFANTIMAVVFELRELLCLHASCVALNGRAVAFVGGPGAGKSTVAAQCVAAGATLLADDITVVSMSTRPGAAVVAPTSRQLKLRPDAAVRQLPAEDLASCIQQYGKYWVQVEGGEPNEHRLVALYLLDRSLEEAGDGEGSTVTGELLTGHAACSALMQYSYLEQLISVLGLHRSRLDRIVQLAAVVPVRGLRLGADLDGQPRVLELVRGQTGA